MQEVSLGKVLFVAALILLSLWLVWPTAQWFSYNRESRVAMTNDRIQELDADFRSYEAKLDEATQAIYEKFGAENAFIQMASSEAVIDLRKQMEENRRKREKERQHVVDLSKKALRLGLDLQGGLHMVLAVDTSDPKFESSMDRDAAVDGVIRVLEGRINSLGVTESPIQKQAGDQILIEMPSARDPEELLRLLGKTAQLEFKLVHEQSGRLSTEILQELDDRRALIGGRFIGDNLVRIRETAMGPTAWVPEEHEARVRGMLFHEDGSMRGAVSRIVRELTEGDYQLALGDLGELESSRPGRETVMGRPFYVIEQTPQLRGDLLRRAYLNLGMGGPRGAQVDLEFNRAGAREFSNVTEANVGRLLAIVLDNTVFSAPRINERIPSGRAQITGSFTQEEARDLTVVLNAGALPATTEPIESRVVDSYLGSDSIRKGLTAGLIGAVVVMIFMIVYYLFCGVVADVALVLNLLFLLAAMVLFRATLTLPGIGGIILFIGMAVDANVLIFERIREDLANRQATALARSIEVAYNNARRTIVDANLTTLIAALVLFEFGTGPIRGFAVTLSLGILISMFTSIFVSRIIVDYYVQYLVKNKKTDRFSTGKIRAFEGVTLPFLSYRTVSLTLSAIVIVAGLTVFALNSDRILGVDFQPGTLLRVGFRQEISTEQVREALSLANVTSQAEVVRQSAALGKGTEGEDFAARYTIRFKSEGEGLQAAQTFMELGLREKFEQVVPGCGAEPLGEDSVGPRVSERLKGQGVQALLWAAVMIVLYVSWRFKFEFAVAAVAALFHDVLISVAIFSLLRAFGMKIEFNLPELAALLTIFGYSINDTIVVFDRVRENVPRARFRTPKLSVTDAINTSITETLSRTIITSVTTLITVIALLIWGGEVLFSFALLLLIGLIAGTYSSIFIASPILVMWEGWRLRKTGKSPMEALRAPGSN